MITKEEAYREIAGLVGRFEEQYDSYRKSDYNETLTRRDFIDPFFKALGWDVDNRSGYAEAYREVIHEDKIKVGGATKAPDYSFRLPGGRRLFFVEAKKPSVSVKEEIQPSYQVRRYGWSAKLPVSLITDFEEFSVYDCTRKPKSTDKASVARIRYLTFRDYLKEFDFIWDTFSKERVLQGSFDRFVQSDTRKKGTATVDREFVQSLDDWRTYLATSISWNNKDLDEDEINFAVQQTLDRIIFLRIAEDRGVETYGTLKEAIRQGNYYENLYRQFLRADEKYNSGLFDFEKDVISRNLKIDNKVVKTIISELYYPECPYEFSVLSVEILGYAYEHFLGKQIRVDKAHRARIEEKPEVRKAGGVYYTPQYVVDYIVKNTVGRLVEGKNPREVGRLKIVDPACGSGSFLLGAYQYLLDWHKDYYGAHVIPSKGGKGHPLTPEGNLTTAEKKGILLNNIYGVDIDVNAVEVTKLSLLLKCLEGETEASIATQLRLFHDRVLPTLDHNIRDGNSLIDTDFYDTQLDFGEDKKIKPFNWQQAFPEVFRVKRPEPLDELKQHYRRVVRQSEELDEKADELIKKFGGQVSEPSITYKDLGGFDAVIGNPPYLGGREWKEENGNAYDYFIQHYEVAEYQFDIYSLFLEKGIRLIKQNGMVGYITPNTWLNNQSSKKLRAYILNNTSIQKVVDYSKNKVFDQATVLPIITILEKDKGRNSITEIFEPIGKGISLVNSVSQSIWSDDDLCVININLKPDDMQLRNRIEQGTLPLGSITQVKFGIKVYQTGKGRPKQKPEAAINKIYESKEKISNEYYPYLKGKDINKYLYRWNGDWLHYGIHLAEPRTMDLFSGNRILVRRIVGETLIATCLNSDLVTGQLLHIVKPHNQTDTKYLLGIINSRLLAYYFRKKYNRQDKTFPEIRIYELASLPIKVIDESMAPIKSGIENLVDQLLQLNEEKAAAKLETRITQLQSRIDYCESRINELVYRLYGLTEEEIGIVEGR
jgi:type I restriction-modification system DNA methylase subunit